jgi:hypothetical protein
MLYVKNLDEDTFHQCKTMSFKNKGNISKGRGAGGRERGSPNNVYTYE